MTIKYKVGQIQNTKVTFVNDEWIGKIHYEGNDAEEALNSCPGDWQFLEEMGKDDWELITIVKFENFEKMYLKKKTSKPF